MNAYQCNIIMKDIKADRVPWQNGSCVTEILHLSRECESKPTLKKANNAMGLSDTPLPTRR